MMAAKPATMRRYLASVLTLIFRGASSPLSPVNHAVASRSAPATVIVVEDRVRFVVQEV